MPQWGTVLNPVIQDISNRELHGGAYYVGYFDIDFDDDLQRKIFNRLLKVGWRESAGTSPSEAISLYIMVYDKEYILERLREIHQLYAAEYRELSRGLSPIVNIRSSRDRLARATDLGGMWTRTNEEVTEDTRGSVVSDIRWMETMVTSPVTGGDGNAWDIINETAVHV